MRMMMTVWTVLCLAPIATWAGSFQDTPGQHLDILENGKPIVRYMYGRDDASETRKHETYKVYHHVMNEAGTDTITKGPHGNFTHHRGLFIGWSRLQHGGSSHDLWHMKKGAVQLHKAIVAKDSDDDRTVLATRIEWLTSDGETVCLEETRTVTVYHDDPEAHTVIDFQSELKAVNGDVELRGDPEHAGMQYRAHQDVAKNASATYMFPADDVDPKKADDLPWAAMTYRLSNGDRYTVQHMNHPANPKGARYSAYRDYGRFGAFFEKPIKDGDTLTVRYRLRITKGDPPSREKMEAEYAAFSK